MKSCRKPLLLLLLTAFLAILTGCTAPKRDTNIPWNRPADWEGKELPGMGGM